MARKEIEGAVEKLLEPVLEADGFELADVEYVRERNWILRLFIDKDGGVDLNDCQAVSEKAGAILDEKDVIPDNYILEVSSPGIDRILKKDKDFLRFAGEKVDIKLFAPLDGNKDLKSFTAVLNGLAEDGSLKLSLEDGTELILDRSKISQVRLHFEF